MDTVVPTSTRPAGEPHAAPSGRPASRIGTDVKFNGPATLWGDGLAALRHVAAQGLAGVNIRTLDLLSPTLDRGYLREFAALAGELGLYVEMGVGKVNPFMTAELPRVRELGAGSYLAGLERMITTCAEFGWTELWTALGGFKPLPGIYFTDRFRTDTTWAEQLRVSEAFLHRLAPVLRDTGCHLNLETHEEVTTFELVALVEAIGPDVLGICLDPANLPVRAELPREGVRRVARYVRATQLRDAVLWRTPAGLSRFLAPCGEGIIDWADLLDVVLAASPGIRLTIEGIGRSRAEMPLHTRDPQWRRGHPDLTEAALAELYRLAGACEERAARGEAPTAAQLREPREDRPSHEEFVRRSADYLVRCLAARGTDAQDGTRK